jgi:hypothetical protein
MAKQGHGESYAAIWREPTGAIARGKAELSSQALRLDGVAADGQLSRREIPYSEIEGVRIGREPEERLNGRPTLVLERVSAPPLQLDVLGAGMLFELADLLAALTIDQRERYQRVTLIVPLKEHALEHAQTLIAEGPPFDPDEKGLERHEVFLTDHEAIFLFEGPNAADIVHRLARDPNAWRTAVKWRRLLAAAPRLAHSAYTWQRPKGQEDLCQ